MIYIENLIENENRLPHQKSALKSVLGDTYLFEKNETYRARRLVAFKEKIKFKKADNAYTIASLIYLPQILKTKIVPYIENRDDLTKFNLSKKRISSEDLIFLGLKKNHLMHETSHVIMWKLAEKNIDLTKKSDFMSAFLISESYANYTETIANLYAKNELHKSFLAMNSFWSYSGEEAKTLRGLHKKHGSLTVNAALFLCFLYTNFLYKKLTSYECDSIRLFIGVNESKLTSHEIKSLFAISSQLNIHFLTKTGEIFWKTLGVGKNPYENIDFDPIDWLLENSKLQKEILNLLAQD